MRNLLKILCLLMVCFSHYSAFAQNFEWLKTFKSRSVANINGITALQGGGLSVLLPIYHNGNSTPDTVAFDTFRFLSPKNREVNYCILKLDSGGKVFAAKKIAEFWVSSNGSIGYCSVMDVCRDENENYYVIAYLGDTLNLIGVDTLQATKGRIVFAKFDRNLNFIWASQTGNSTAIAIFRYSNAYNNKETQLFFSQGHLYFICVSTGITKIGNVTHYLGPRISAIYGEINLTDGSPKWSNYFYSSSTPNDFNITGLVRLKGKLYFSGDLGLNSNYREVIIHGDTFYAPGGFIIETDTMGNYLRRFVTHNSNYFGLTCITTDGVHLYIGGYFRDSLQWGNKIISPEYPTNPKTKGTTIYFELFAASLTTSFEPRWFFRPKIIDKTLIPQSTGVLNNVVCNNGYLYFGGNLSSKVLIDSIILGEQSWNGIISFKSDSLGNILWATNSGGGIIHHMDVIANKSVFSAGWFHSKIKFGNYEDSAMDSYDAFITKITDYDITRGKVSGGPYCAGDTIKVPYTHIGNFDTSNYFIAELSDENGNFEGGQRELGRIKTNLDSVVPGILPLFQVASSPHYRIRVRSTAPAIQSYYILDTLRLLIYSKDKADPGPPDTICYRDTFQLNTFGGTRWTWSPKYMMDDSSLRQPFIWPDTTTVYQIIIGDSSGCGAPDTAFKTIYVKPKPVLFGDTVYNKCEGRDLKLKFSTLHTDSSGHKIRWYQNNKLYFSNDSMIYGDEAATVFKAVLTDNCSPAKDSVYVKVNYLGPLKVVRPKDTVVCFGDELRLTAKATGGIAAQYVYDWYNSKTEFVGNGTPTVTITKTDTFKVVLSDGCSINSDSAIQIVSVSKKINTQDAMGLPNDTTFCGSFSTTLKIKNADKDDQFAWVDLNEQISAGTSDTLRWAKAGTLEATVTNSCGTTKDTIVIKQLSTPKIKLDSLYDACENISLKLDISNSKNEETYLWSTTETTPTIATTKAGEYWAKATNYCGEDSVNFKVVLYPKPSPNFTVADVCEGEPVNFQNKTSGGKVFEWRFGDGTISADSAPNKTYAITQNSRTYFVTLLAKISSNCRDSISKPLNVKAISDGGFTHTSQDKTVFFTQTATEPGESYKWYFGDGDSSAAINPTHQYKADSGTYNVCLNIINPANCQSQVCRSVHYSVGIDEVEKNLFEVYPNPTDGTVHLEFSKPISNAEISLFNVMGEKVFELPNPISGLEIRLDIGHLPDGVYLIRFTHSDITTNQKIVLLK